MKSDKSITVRMTEKQREKVDRIAKRWGRYWSASDVVRRLVDDAPEDLSYKPGM